MFCFAADVKRGLSKSGRCARNPAEALSKEFLRAMFGVLVNGLLAAKDLEDQRS